MILVDASILIDVLRGGDPSLQRILITQNAAISGVTLAEARHGAKTD